MDEELTSKDAFNSAASENSRETERLMRLEEARAFIAEQEVERNRDLTKIEQDERQSAEDMTQRPETPEQQPVAYDDLTLDHNPPVRVEDRSTEQQAFTRENTAQEIQQKAETREEMFNNQARGEQVSPYLRDDQEQDQSQGDDDISY